MLEVILMQVLNDEQSKSTIWANIWSFVQKHSSSYKTELIFKSISKCMCIVIYQLAHIECKQDFISREARLNVVLTLTHTTFLEDGWMFGYLLCREVLQQTFSLKIKCQFRKNKVEKVVRTNSFKSSFLEQKFPSEKSSPNDRIRQSWKKRCWSSRTTFCSLFLSQPESKTYSVQS